MQFTHFLLRFLTLFASIVLLTCGMAGAQTSAIHAATPTASAPTASAPAVSAKQAPEQRVQRIHIEDDQARIDEVRIGSETKSILVQPKNGLPAYQVAPVSGERSWKILGF
jgi:hypothetical protein